MPEVPRVEHGSVEPAPRSTDAMGGHLSAGYLGVVVPRQSADVSARFGALLVRVEVDLGDVVEQGQPVALLDDRALRDDLRVAEAALRSSRAAVGRGLVDVDETKQKLAMLQGLANEGVVSRRELLEADSAHRRAKADLEVAKAVVDERGVRVSKLQGDREDTVLLAPFAGTVALRYHDPGVLVADGEPIVRIITTGGFRVRFAVPPADARKLADGQAAQFVADTMQDGVPATVTRIAPELDPSSQMIFGEAQLNVPAELAGKVQAGVVGRLVMR